MGPKAREENAEIVSHGDCNAGCQPNIPAGANYPKSTT